jgi:subtilisin family serine protease
MRVPVRAIDRDPKDPGDSAQVQVWVTFRQGADLKVGLASPDGTWIEPVEAGVEAGKNTDKYNAGVISGATKTEVIPPGSRGAVVVWSGNWPAGTYEIVLEGEGMAELYLQGVGDAGPGGRRPASFVNGVREGTVNLPATHPAIISVGATTNLPRWMSITGAEVSLRVPLLDASGSLPAPRVVDPRTKTSSLPQRDLQDGEVCWFSSAGPTATGVQKPEIAAPGAMVASSMSRQAKPGQPYSIFSTEGCPAAPNGRIDQRCLQFDTTSAMALGTSMASPVVAGVVSLLLQRDPTLTQDKIVALLQGGAHRFERAAPFDDQSGPGEVDAVGALDALDRMQVPKLALPAAAQSWLVLSSTYVPADGSTPVTAIVELRTASGEERADLFGADRLAAHVAVDGVAIDPAPALQRRGPGVWVYAWTPPPGLGGSRATFGATFDGQPIVLPRTVAIATDGWTARYPSAAGGSGCAVTRAPGEGGERARDAALLGAGLACALASRVVRRSRPRA